MNPAKSPASKAPDGALTTLLVASLLVVSSTLALRYLSFFSNSSVFVSLSAWLMITLLVWNNLPLHTHRRFGIANTITCVRATITVLLLGVVMIAHRFEPSSTELWPLTVMAAIALSMDGLDGYLARRTGLCSDFGARFDMEIDALIIMALTLLVWQSGITGIWILALGLMRYVFLAASLFLPALARALFPSIRRKIVCVIQVSALCLMLSPWTQAPLAGFIGFVALLCLSVSFTRDTMWLLQADGSTELPGTQAQSRTAIRTNAKPGKQPINEINA